MIARESPTEARHHQIGTVSSLTGVDVHTIRAWERRYGAIKPLRSATGRRRYDDGCIERLQLPMALVDCSEGIGTIVHLADDELRARRAKVAEHEVAFEQYSRPCESRDDDDASMRRRRDAGTAFLFAAATRRKSRE